MNRRGTAIRRYVLLSLFAVPWILVPFWLLLVNSFKSQGDASVLSLAWPKSWHAAANYGTVIREGSYFLSLGNSAAVAVPTLLLVLLFGSMAAWAYARSESISMRVAYYATTLSIILPPAVIPTIYVLSQLGINGSRTGYILAMAGGRLGVLVFLATGFIRGIPIEFEEAAQLDGAGRWQIYTRIILPSLRPVLFTGAVIMIISVWNDFFFALYLIQGSAKATLPLSLYTFASAGTEGLRWNLVFAHVVLTSLPMLVAYLLLQRRILSGLTEGGVTG
jgi:raffinose/stachyose/melibiose transport system permease protein